MSPPVFVLLIPLLLISLAGCQSAMGNAALDMAKMAFMGAPQPTGADLDPRFSYIRVTAGKQVAFLALGNVDPHPQGGIEVYYSANREVLRLQEGRLVGATGTFTEWRQVRLQGAPAWTEALVHNRAMLWTRLRDVMPGYQFNQEDRLTLRPISPPGHSAVVGIDPAGLRWFEERRISEDAKGRVDEWRPARYALDVSAGLVTVVYGEQCLSADFCLTWQRWKAPQ